MEPMALGSPPSPTNNYLPSFLMGDNSPAVTQTPTITSPSRNKAPTMFRTTTPADCKNLRQKLFKDQVESPYNSFGNASMEKGPPKQSLFDTLDANKTPKTPVLSSTMHPMASHDTFTSNESFSRIGNESLNVTQSVHGDSQMLNMSESFHRTSTSRPRTRASHWVTIFGFPPSSASVALSHFSTFGQITERKFPTQGNYVHIKYANIYDVSKALAMNGKIIMTCVMVGVVPYYPDENKENAESPHEITSPIRARSLRQSYVSPNGSSTILPVQNVPQKSTGIVTKAMEYVFGW